MSGSDFAPKVKVGFEVQSPQLRVDPHSEDEITIVQGARVIPKEAIQGHGATNEGDDANDADDVGDDDEDDEGDDDDGGDDDYYDDDSEDEEDQPVEGAERVPIAQISDSE